MASVSAPPPYQFSCDLVRLAKHHIQFLQALHEHGVTLSRPSTESLRRYRDLWLPLVYEHPNLDLIPPVDVAWLWHCHRLAPFRYSSYCKKHYDTTVLEATPPFVAHFGQDDEVFCLDQDDDSIQDMVSHTIGVWNDRYPDESFCLVDTSESSEHHGGLHDKNDSSVFLDGFDLLSSTDRQKNFLWQVSAPNFSDQTFLEEGLVNYHKFLFLKKMCSDDMIVVPTYQIDLIWHTHILSSMAGYYQDCKAIIGVSMHHDDSLEDRSEGGPLDTAFTATVVAWKELYGKEYVVEGAMYRGEPPKQFYNPAFVLESKRMKEHFMRPLHGHPFNEFVGVQGASSTNPTTKAGANSEEVSSTPPKVKWTNPLGRTADGTSGFIARSFGANRIKSNYVFGSGPRGVGYYHVTTKESYEILSKRIAGRILLLPNDIAIYRACRCCAPSEVDALTKEMEKELRELEEYLAFVDARAKAKQPVGEIEIPVNHSITSASAKNPYRRDDFYDRNGTWLFPPVLYNCGGGCGTTGGSGGAKNQQYLVLGKRCCSLQCFFIFTEVVVDVEVVEVDVHVEVEVVEVDLDVADAAEVEVDESVVPDLRGSGAPILDVHM
jgi:hypothetical protein